jgi:3-phosphoglycerate kinase
VKEIEEPVPEEPEEEKFYSHTIHRFKKSLGNLGQIYVNDAPLASLTNSNTVSEIKCPQKVMGMKMTEEMRNIAQFFMK